LVGGGWGGTGRDAHLSARILDYEATVVALEAELDGYRAKGGAFYEDGMSFEAKMRADAEARVRELEAEVARLTPPTDVEHCDRCGRPTAKDAAQRHLRCEEYQMGSLCQDCYDLHALEGEILTLKWEAARLTPPAATGGAVEGMKKGMALEHRDVAYECWQVWTGFPDHPAPRVVDTDALAALRAAEALVSPPLSTTGVVTSESGDDAKEGDGNA
jgi:hypothetical protein